MIRVTCAIIRNEDNEVLIVQRGEKSDLPFKWEFPGGKLKEGESDEECIIREIKEELSIDIVICSRLAEVEYDYGAKHILLVPFVCDTLDELPVLSEHIAFKWTEPADMERIDFAEADVIVAKNYIDSINADNISPVQITISEDQASLDNELRSMVINVMGTQEVEWIAASANDNPVIFKKLFDYSFSKDKKLAFRSSWILSKVCDKSPELIYPYLINIIELLERIDNESTERSFLRILTLTDMYKVSSKHHGILADHCFSALRSGFSAIAIKAYSMEILYKLAIIYPELVHELAATINMLQGEGSAGIVSRGRIILKKLAGISKDSQNVDM